MTKRFAVAIVVMFCVLLTGCLKKLEENLDVSDFAVTKKSVKMASVSTDDREGLKIIGNEDKIIQNEDNTKNESNLEGKREEEQSLVLSCKPTDREEKKEKLRDESVDTCELKYRKIKGEYRGNVLDIEVLDEENNDKYSWWLRLNSEHELSGIDPHAEKIVKDYDIIYAGDTSKKKIYLTFDEGYENGYTPMILDTLKENNVSAIFFITGSYLRRNPELVKRMLEEGHEVGSHSVNHPSFPDIATKDYDRLEREMLNLEQEFYDKFGIGFSYIRPPRGEYSERTLKAAMQLGYKNVFWSYAYKDYDVNDQRGTEYAYNKVMDHLHNGMVVLLHAVSKDNANMLDRLIKEVKSKGYEIAPFDL